MPREGETAPALDPHRSRLNWHIRKPTFGPKRLAVKNHFIAICGEMVGMTLFMIFSLGGNDRRRHGGHKCHGPYAPWTGWIDGDNAQHVEPRVAALLVRFDAADFLSSPVLYIAFSFGISLNVIAWCFYRVTGGPFNPAITLGMLLVGALSPLRAALLVVSQILGGITGAAIIQALLPNTLNVRTTLGGGVSVARGLFIENVRFAYPSFRWLAASISLMRTATSTVYSSLPRNRGNFIAPLPIGLSLFASELVSVYWTGGSLNKFLEYETLLGPEPSEDCHDPVLQLSSWTEGVSAGEGVDPNEGYMIEATGLGDLLHSTSSDSRNTSPGQHRRLSLPAYDARFDKLENMLSRLLEEGELSKMEHGANGSLFQRPPCGHEKAGSGQSMHASIVYIP